jgi:hypothetical protein
MGQGDLIEELSVEKECLWYGLELSKSIVTHRGCQSTSWKLMCGAEQRYGGQWGPQPSVVGTTRVDLALLHPRWCSCPRSHLCALGH